MDLAPDTPPPPRTSAIRLLAGSHLLLLVQSLLVLASPADLAPPRPGIAAICMVAMICLGFAAAEGRIEQAPRIGRPRHAA